MVGIDISTAEGTEVLYVRAEDGAGLWATMHAFVPRWIEDWMLSFASQDAHHELVGFPLAPFIPSFSVVHLHNASPALTSAIAVRHLQ